MSKSTIAELLRQYSQESVEAGDEGETNVEEGQVGAEEVLVVTDEHTTELEEAIEEIADTVNQKVEAEAALDNVLEATESLESAIRAIENARLQGHRVNGVAMQIWANGVVDSMEARQIPSEVFASLQAEYGESFEADSYADYSTEALEKTKAIMAKIWGMIKAAFAAVRDWFTRFMAWFGKSAEAIEKAGIKLKKAAAGKKNATATNTKIGAGPYSDLVSGGTLKPTEVVKWVAETVKSTASDARMLHGELMTAANTMETEKTASTMFSNTNDAIAKLGRVFEKGALSGKIATITIEADKEKGKLSYKIKTDSTGFNKAKGDVNILSVSEIETLGGALETAGRSVSTVLRELNAQVGKSGSINFAKDLEGEGLVNARKAARIIVAGTKVAQNITSDVAKLTLPLAKKAYACGVACLRRYK